MLNRGLFCIVNSVYIRIGGVSEVRGFKDWVYLRLLRDWLRAYFSVVVVESVPCTQDTTRGKPKRRRQRNKSVPPSERFIFGVVLLMTALVGLIVLEAVYIVVTGTVNSEMVAGITGLIGGVVTVFFLGKKK